LFARLWRFFSVFLFLFCFFCLFPVDTIFLLLSSSDELCFILLILFIRVFFFIIIIVCM
jgi:hypothetical protein